MSPQPSGPPEPSGPPVSSGPPVPSSSGSLSVQACAGGIVFDESRQLLVVRRGRAPGAGLWTIPGGRCLPGEVPADACVRELFEETGLAVRVLRHVGTVRRAGLSVDVVYDIDDFLCEQVGGVLRAGDDADGVRWVTLAELRSMPVVDGLFEALSGWGVLPG